MPEDKPLTGWSRFMRDVKRLSKIAAGIGAVLAIVCHLLPPHWRAPCDALARFCAPFED